jgi:LysM repeat protein
MDDNLDNEMKEFGEEIADGMGYTRKEEPVRRRRTSIALTSQRKILALGGAGILLLIILIALFSRGGNEVPPEDLASVQVRLNQLEERISRLEGMKDKIVFIEQQEKELQQSIAEAEKSGRSLTARLDKLTQKVDGLRTRKASPPAKTGASLTVKRKPFPLAKGRYHEVRPGESLYRIAQQYGTSVDELCRLNNITPNQVIYPGEKLLVAPESHK